MVEDKSCFSKPTRDNIYFINYIRPRNQLDCCLARRMNSSLLISHAVFFFQRNKRQEMLK